MSDLDAIEREWREDSVHRRTPGVPEMLAEIREARALIAALKAEGCPERHDESGDPWCAWCGCLLSTFGSGEPEHRPMEDGSPCLWIRIERA